MLNSTNKAFMVWQANDFEVIVFFNSSSRKSIRPTSCDAFVLLEQLASPSEEWILLNKSCFCLTKLNHKSAHKELSHEASCIKKPLGSSLLPDLNKLTVILCGSMSFRFKWVRIAQENKLLSVYLPMLSLLLAISFKFFRSTKTLQLIVL